MEWKEHDKWARKLGIPEEVSKYVNRIVDVQDESELPEEYKQFIDKYGKIKQEEDGAKKGNSALHMVIAKHVKTSHDGAGLNKTASKFSAEGNLKFFQYKGDDYVRAWYLHHYLDHFDENEGSEKTFQQLLEEYDRPRSQEIENFLVEHKDELTRTLNLGNR